MNDPKLQNNIIYSNNFSKNLFLVLGMACMAFSAQVTVEEAASKWISHSKSTAISDGVAIDFHPSEILDIIAREGHSLPENIKADLIELGFDFSGEIVSRGRPILENPQFVDSDFGLFRFHYTTTGDHAVLPEDDDNNDIPDYVEMMVASFDDVYVIDFDRENYTPPPSDSWYYNQDNGGSGKYDVYIFDLGDGIYGYVQGENYAQNFSEITRGDNENSPDMEENNAVVSYMAMRNNYNGFSNTEIENIQVTSAHEFYHAIQYGYDAFERSWIKESSAVWMEEIHYDDINDCYQYLPLFFESPWLGPNWETVRKYGSYIYISYMVDNHFEIEFMRSFWENSISHDSFDSDYSIITVKETMDQYNPNFSNGVFSDNQFEKITNDFLTANALLTNNAIYDSIYHYEEVSNENWPITEPIYELEIDSLGTEPIFLPEQLVGTFGANYYKVNVSDLSLENISIELLSIYPEEGNLYLTIINNDLIQTTHMNADEQVVDVTASNEVLFFISAFTYDLVDLLYSIRIVPNSTVSTDQLAIESDQSIPNFYFLNENNPNPFNPFTTLSYFIPEQGHVVIDISNVNGQRVKTYTSGIQAPGKHSIKWDGKDEKGSKLESGIFFYTMNVDGRVIDTKKMLLLK